MGLRVVFFGTPAFAVPALEALVLSSHSVVGVVTQPDKPRGRGQQVTAAPVKAFATAHHLPVLQPVRLARDLFESAFIALGADIGVVAAYGKLLPDWLLAAPRLGLINLHASLLPRYRGASPIHRAVMAGDVETGVTIMRVITALDAGPTIAQSRRAIGPDDTAVEVERGLALLGAPLVVSTLDRMAVAPVVETPQDDALATLAPRLTKAEGVVHWARPARAIHNQVRGLTPWPHAYAFLGGERVILHRSHVDVRITDRPPGTVVSASSADGVFVACGDGCLLELVDIQFEGRRLVPARAAAAGGAILADARFDVA